MITPLEIQNQEFKAGWKGYDKEEVKHFLYLLSEDYESLLEQNRNFSRELAVLRARLKDMDDRDKILKDTLISAQQIKKEIHQNAQREADLTIREGQHQAETIFENAKKEVDKVAHQIQELRRVRNDILAEVEMMVARFTHFVDVERQLAQESDKLHGFVFGKAEPSRIESRSEKTGS